MFEPLKFDYFNNRLLVGNKQIPEIQTLNSYDNDKTGYFLTKGYVKIYVDTQEMTQLQSTVFQRYRKKMT